MAEPKRHMDVLERVLKTCPHRSLTPNLEGNKQS